jgi:metal-responsive CopG/Arc/MetJ family transcriptional regulator
MKNEVKRLSINLPSSLLDKLDSYADELNVNRTAALSVALSTFFKEQETMHVLKELADASKNA